MLPAYPSSPEAAKRFLAFVNASPTPFHAIHNASARLESSGFKKVSRAPAQASIHVLKNASQIRETDDWEKSLQPRGKYYFTRLVDSPTVLHNLISITGIRVPWWLSLFRRTGNKARAYLSWQHMSIARI